MLVQKPYLYNIDDLDASKLADASLDLWKNRAQVRETL